MSLLDKKGTKDYPINLVIKLDKRNRAFRGFPMRKRKSDWGKKHKNVR